MPNISTHSGSSTAWWHQLGLSGGFDLESRSARKLLKLYRPTVFVSRSDDGEAEKIGFDQLVALIEEAERTERTQHEAAIVDRAAAAQAEFEAAFTLPDADKPIVDGRWAGFSRGEATAWCHNLFQYEPHGFVHPGSEVRVRALAALRDGQLPEVFGYPERARELRDSGLTPRLYREYREALGARTFDPSEVRHR
ncbi:hypothetical protein ACR5KS_11695 [Leucobacter sp. W1153]|uniref:hypothetical protein n=1 Tax=Leucobacter sp. W1153 TaxID=3439064 RepID=UPI003F33B595